MTAGRTTLGRDGQGGISGPVLIALHLLPGLIFAGFFLILGGAFVRHGLPGYLALLLAIPLCLAPMELGALLFWSARFAGKRSLSPAIAYRRPGTAADYVVWPLCLYACWAVLSFGLNRIAQVFDSHLTFWLPAWATQEALVRGLAGSPPAQWPVFFGLGVVLSGFVAPVVEELYFRGFLLPRMEQWGWVAPAVNALLFAVYHFYFPGNVPGVFVAFLPICYVVMRKKNWRIGLIAHCLFNLTGVITLARLIT